VRELESGVESPLDPGPGLLVRAALSGDGTSIDVIVVALDTDGNGKLEAPKQRTSLYQGGCAGPAYAAYFGGRSGDAPIHRVLAIDGSLRRDVPGFVGFVGRRWVRRLDDGALRIEAATGEPTTIAAAALKAKVLATDDASGVVLLAPSADGDEVAVLEAGPTGVHEIGVRLHVDAKVRDVTRRRSDRITEFGPRDESEFHAFDWSKGAPVATRGRLVACEGAHALVLRDETLVLLDVDSRTETALPGTIEHFYGEVWRAGPFAAMNGLVIDLVHAKVVGTYRYPYPYSKSFAPEWGLRDDGALLRSRAPCTITSEQGSGDSALPRGPFRWEAPTPPK
jgi:hypothetical protein